MSYCRTTIVEYNSEIDADEAQADYVKKAASEFLEAEILLAIRTGPTSGVAVSVYPDEETSDKTMAARNARMGKMKDVTKNHELHEGEVALSIVR